MKHDLLRHRLNVERSGQANSTDTSRSASVGEDVANQLVGVPTSEQAAPLPIRKVDGWYEAGVLGDVSVATLRCNHLAFDIDQFVEWTACWWCSP